jgi:CheY-like chemotaxis protein
MPKPLHVLHVEDSPAEAQLMARAVREAGEEVDWSRVESEAEYVRALRDRLDFVIADYHLPTFSGLRALELPGLAGLRRTPYREVRLPGWSS